MSTCTIVPTLETSRLILRGFEPGDTEPYFAMMADPLVTRYLSDGKPFSEPDAWRQLAMFAGHWVLRGFGVWAVQERSSGAFIGRVGCFEPHGWPAFEVAYTLARHAWGKGYAREAAAASLTYARDVLHRTEVASIIRPDNAGSIGVATSLGATRAETVEFYGAPAHLYRYPKA